MLPKLRPDVTVQHVGEESLILDMRSGQIHQLNATASWILAQCDGATSMESIVKDFADYFSVGPETAMSDVTATLEQLKQVEVIDLD